MPPDVMTTVQRLALYLRQHPHVCDTAEGIARWWLHGEAPAPVVEAALGWMLARGAIEPLPAADGRTRLRRSTDPLAATRLDALAANPAALAPLTPLPPGHLPRQVH